MRIELAFYTFLVQSPLVHCLQMVTRVEMPRNIFIELSLRPLSQYILPAIVHITHQPYLQRGDGPMVSPFLASLSVRKSLAVLQSRIEPTRASAWCAT